MNAGAPTVMRYFSVSGSREHPRRDLPRGRDDEHGDGQGQRDQAERAAREVPDGGGGAGGPVSAAAGWTASGIPPAGSAPSCTRGIVADLARPTRPARRLRGRGSRRGPLSLRAVAERPCGHARPRGRPASTSDVTTAFAPITAPSPTCRRAEDLRARADVTRGLERGRASVVHGRSDARVDRAAGPTRACGADDHRAPVRELEAGSRDVDGDRVAEPDRRGPAGASAAARRARATRGPAGWPRTRSRAGGPASGPAASAAAPTHSAGPVPSS